MAQKSGLFVVQDKWKKIHSAISGLPQRDVLVGIPLEKTDRDPQPNEPAGITNAALGFIHNYGAPEQNIPERNFMESGIADVQPKVDRYLKQAAKAAMQGNLELTEKCLHAVGLTAQAGVRERIQTGPFEPLAASTLAARRRKGRTGEKPLLDTAQMRNAITYVVRTSKVVK